MTLTQGSNLTGNAFAQTLVGNGAANVLDGRGGADRMEGRAGNDTYVVDNAGDVASEAGGGGTDTVQSSVQFNLAGIRVIGAIENLLLTGTAAINGFGNTLSNRIEGNDRANILTGLGGADTLVGNDGADRLDGGNGNDMLVGGANSDRLTGGSGVDSFYFGSAPGIGGYDTLTDFSVSTETIYLGAGGFGALGQSGGVGTLKAEHFHVGAAAADADDRIIYNPINGSLLFDPDGDGGGGAVRFAILDKGLNLSSLDFVIY